MDGCDRRGGEPRFRRRGSSGMSVEVGKIGNSSTLDLSRPGEKLGWRGWIRQGNGRSRGEETGIKNLGGAT